MKRYAVCITDDDGGTGEAVFTVQRKERHNGRWDNPNYTCWMNEDDKKRLARFLSNERGESGVYPWFSSTGRKKPWCE